MHVWLILGKDFKQSVHINFIIKTTSLGLLFFATWAWNIVCAPDVFTWNFAFMLLNLAQVFHILYQLRPVKFDAELEEAYHTLFEPFKVTP